MTHHTTCCVYGYDRQCIKVSIHITFRVAYIIPVHLEVAQYCVVTRQQCIVRKNSPLNIVQLVDVVSTATMCFWEVCVPISFH